MRNAGREELQTLELHEAEVVQGLQAAAYHGVLEALEGMGAPEGEYAA